MHSLCRQETPCDILVSLFDREFSRSFNTQLIKGGTEPEYLPSQDEQQPHRIVFTKDYFSSALHEVAHWCVAGKARRQQADYGYWYVPDGRNEGQQAEFERVEVKPQALEWLFSAACRVRFRISADNLAADAAISDSFKRAILGQVHDYCEKGVNARAEQFLNALLGYYQTFPNINALLNSKHYTLDAL